MEAAREALAAWGRLRGLLEGDPGAFLAGRLRDYVLEPGGVAWEGYSRGLGSRGYGVDSSRTRPIRVGFRMVSFVSAATVYRDPGGGGGVVWLRVEPVLLPEDARPGFEAVEATLRMFRLEAAALERAVAGGGPVFLDGPIVDPPVFLGTARAAGLEEEYLDYVGWRAGLARAAGGSRALVGFVKRLQGRLVAGYLESMVEGLEGVGDGLLAAALASYLVEALRAIGACPGPGGVVVSRPVPLDPSRVPDVGLYEERMGGRVYTALYVPGACMGNLRRAARLEFVVPEGGDPGELALYYAGLAEAWVRPGLWAPEPVYLAHRATTIRGRESAKLLREALGRYALEALREGARGLEGLWDAFKP